MWIPFTRGVFSRVQQASKLESRLTVEHTLYLNCTKLVLAVLGKLHSEAAVQKVLASTHTKFMTTGVLAAAIWNKTSKQRTHTSQHALFWSPKPMFSNYCRRENKNAYSSTLLRGVDLVCRMLFCSAWFLMPFEVKRMPLDSEQKLLVFSKWLYPFLLLQQACAI